MTVSAHRMDEPRIDHIRIDHIRIDHINHRLLAQLEVSPVDERALILLQKTSFIRVKSISFFVNGDFPM